MNYYTIDYDVNRPMENQITVPMNSEYGIGVRVIKDNEPVNLEMGELSVNGMSATSQVNGYNLYELSSGNDTGMNTLDVEARKEPTVGKEINPVGEAVNTSNRAKTFSIIVPLSAFFDSDITIKPEDVKVLSFKTRTAADTAEYPDEWTDTQTTLFAAGKWMSF